MGAGFAGETAGWYAGYRRDLPARQARELAGRLRLDPDRIVVDLGCGTGQLGVPLRPYCAGVLAVDPEPAMLAGLRARAVPGIVCLLGDDSDLPDLRRWLGRPVGAVVVGNALHLMDEPAALAACAGLLPAGAAVAVVTQGPPLWLGPAPWQQQVRATLERALGPVTDTCGSDAAALAARAGALAALGLHVQTVAWNATHPVDSDWIVGHLGSALPAGTLQDQQPGGLAQALRTALQEHPEPDLTEQVSTTAVIAHRPG